VINNTSHTISSFALDGGAQPIFGFDNDGINGYANGGPIVNNAQDGTGYGGLNAYFTNIVGNTGVVNFITPIAAGSHDFFSLEEPASLNLTVRNVPEPLTLSLFSAGLIGAAALRRKAKKKA